MSQTTPQTLIQITNREVQWNYERWPCTIGKSGLSWGLRPPDLTPFPRDQGAVYPYFIRKNNLKEEGDSTTPMGTVNLVAVLYRNDRIPPPSTHLPSLAIQPHWGWSDDPKATSYNHLVMRPYGYSHEILWRDDSLYDLVVVTSYNWPKAVKTGGSAIFIHQMNFDNNGQPSPTAGCLGLKLKHLIQLVEEATPKSRWVIDGIR